MKIYLYKITTRKCGDPDEDHYVTSLCRLRTDQMLDALYIKYEVLENGSLFYPEFDHVYFEVINAVTYGCQ